MLANKSQRLSGSIGSVLTFASSKLPKYSNEIEIEQKHTTGISMLLAFSGKPCNSHRFSGRLEVRDFKLRISLAGSMPSRRPWSRTSTATWALRPTSLTLHLINLAFCCACFAFSYGHCAFTRTVDEEGTRVMTVLEPFPKSLLFPLSRLQGGHPCHQNSTHHWYCSQFCPS